MQENPLNQSPAGLPEFPKLRPVDPKWIEHEGRHYLYLRDPLSLAQEAVLVPKLLVPLLGLCDGTRDLDAIRAGLALRTGFPLPSQHVRDFVEQLDSALLLENGSFRSAVQRALAGYRAAPYRPMSLAGTVYPADPAEFTAAIAAYCAGTPPADTSGRPSGDLVGVVTPHIDYQRGSKTYASVWQAAAPDLRDVELAIVFGTDHTGSLGSLTLTQQSYATPFGVLPTERGVVNDLAKMLGDSRAFGEEFHHSSEHSIELAAAWLHHAIGGRECPVVPILCGSFHHFVSDGAKPQQDEQAEAALAHLRGLMAQRRTVVIAAGDLAHVGLAFGDPVAVDIAGKARLAERDAKTLDAVCAGDAEGVLAQSRAEGDARRLCGLPPIYFALQLLEGTKGISTGYAQCPADANGGSLVSIAGALLYRGQP
ncbi:MAG: AmmeMemoRadiSam system protein B [SAR202 cluster bacterium]|nr:AmmeMemoRadiSam system protein B [SAR202 cluster bacterium]